MGYIGVIFHLLTIDPNFLGHPTKTLPFYWLTFRFWDIPRSPRKRHSKNREFHQVDDFFRFGNFNHPKIGDYNLNSLGLPGKS